MTEVVAALLRQDGKFLICQRPAHKARGLLWEFPGGKVEPGETMAQALARECREELGVTVAVEEPVAQVVHEYPDLTIRLTLLAAVITGGRLQSWSTMTSAGSPLRSCRNMNSAPQTARFFPRSESCNTPFHHISPVAR